MSSELSILGVYGLVVIGTLILQVLLAAKEFGLMYLATARDDGRKQTGMGARSLRCLENSVVAMALFAPAVLLLAVQDAFSGVTLLCAQAFLVARVLYIGVYRAGIPWLRTILWTVGFLATAYMYLAAI